jgi:hypothetical protein
MILNSPYISGSLTVTNLSGSGVRYLMTSASGLLISQTADAAIKVTYTASSTAGQTVFPVTNGYSTGLVDVYLNGTKLASSDYSDADGVNITLVTGSDAGDLLEFVKYSPALGVTNNALRQLTTFTSSEGQTVYSASYTPGLLDVYYNGSRLTSAEYTANNGTFITLATGSVAGDIVDLLVYSYQVGAFSGVGGTGVANQIAYWGTTNAITGSPNFTVSGSTLAVTGSFTVITGSVAEFTVNPTGVNIGNVSTDTHTITGSVNVSGSLNTVGTITAQTLVVQTVTSSVSFITGSTRFGTTTSNTHQFTGSLFVTGGLNITTGSVGIGTTSFNTNYSLFVANPSSTGAYIGVSNQTGATGDRTLRLGFASGGTAATIQATRIATADDVNLSLQPGGGNVGIGTGTPTYKLQVSTGAAGNIALFTDNIAQTLVFKTDASSFFLDETNGGNMIFQIASVEKMRLSTTGCLKVEGNTMGWTIGQVSGENRIQYNAGSFACLSTANGFTAIAASAFNVNSDYRLKEDLKDFNNSLNIVDSIKIYDFKWKDRDERNYGVLAHELQEVLPYAVYGKKDGVDQNKEIITQGVDYGKLVPVLVKALQEANAKITALEEKLERNNIQ